MGTQGSFGYKIGRKVRLMQVQFDADLLWQVCVREIYILMKHFGSIESLQQAFESLKEAKGKPKLEAIEKCKIYTELNVSQQSREDWYYLLRYCQLSFINMLESGYILNNGNENSLVFIIDFNTNSVRFYTRDSQKNVQEYESAKIAEIMEFDDMPTQSYTEIITDMRDRFINFSTNLERINEELKKIEEILHKSKQINDHNIMSKAQHLWDDMECERKKIELEYRYFYYRLEALNLIDHS
jgi:hypothetical protein